MYSLSTYIFWFISNYAHGILIIYSIAEDSESTDGTLAAVIRILETAASSSFVGIIVLAFFSHTTETDLEDTNPKETDSKLYFPLKYAVLSTWVIYFIAVFIMVILSMHLDSEGLVISALVALVVFRSILFLTSALVLFVVILCKSNSLKKKEQFCSLWNDNKLLVIALPYILLSYTYFLYTLTTILNNSCTEDIQLYREVWLVLNCVLRFCEIIFSIAYFIKTVKLVKEPLANDGPSEKDSNSVLQGSNRKRILHMLEIVAEPVAKPVGSGETNYHSNLEESLAENYPKNLHTAKTENSLTFVPNLDVEKLSQSTVLSLETSRLYQSIDSERFLDAENFSDKTETSSNKLFDGKRLRLAAYLYYYVHIHVHTNSEGSKQKAEDVYSYVCIYIYVHIIQRLM